MKSYLISDNVDTLVGLKISGINGVVVHSREEVLKVIDDLLKNKEIGIIIITEKIGLLIPDKLKEVKLSKFLPLIIEIPDRHGSIKEEDSILTYIKEAIGLKI